MGAWLHEIKRFPAVAAAVDALRCRSCLIDGEVVVCGKDGVALFDRLRRGGPAKPEAMLYALR